jgi:AcrR family transcriptional regulator
MPRPKSDEKRSAILEAATRIIVTQGLSAPTAGIAKEAGVANGSLFTYFETKTDLFNQLYLELKTEMASAAMKDLPTGAEPREQLLHLWRHWMNWAVSYPRDATSAGTARRLRGDHAGDPCGGPQDDGRRRTTA